MKKKNRTWRAAALLLVLTLVTSCFVGGTFAKYTTTGEAIDTARVAKFGVTIEANGTMFANEYANDAKINETAVGATLSVQAEAGTDGSKSDLVAPGTKGELANATITGTPEVAVHVGYTAELTLSNWTVDGATYCPLIIKVGDETYGLTGMKDSAGAVATQQCVDIAALETAVETAIAGYSKDYAPKTDLSKINETGGYVNVSWEWAFDKNDDVKDTALGNAETAATVSLKITTTVEQID